MKLTPEELAAIQKQSSHRENNTLPTDWTIQAALEAQKEGQALLKHIRGMDESTCKWCGITRSGWCKRAEAQLFKQATELGELSADRILLEAQLTELTNSMNQFLITEPTWDGMLIWQQNFKAILENNHD